MELRFFQLKSWRLRFFLQIFKLWQICARCCSSITDPAFEARLFLQQLVLHGQYCNLEGMNHNTTTSTTRPSQSSKQAPSAQPSRWSLEIVVKEFHVVGHSFASSSARQQQQSLIPCTIPQNGCGERIKMDQGTLQMLVFPSSKESDSKKPNGPK